jgi:hypothetical protein
LERKNSPLYVILALFLVSGAVSADPGGFLGKNIVEARRVLRERLSEEKNTLVGARALSALIFLERLSGNDDEAVKLWTTCDLKCRKLLPLDERAALETWRKQ